LIDSLVAHGLRAELKTGNLITGQKYVDMDMHPDAPAEKIRWSEQPTEFPTVSNGLDDIQDSVGGIARKLNKVPFDQISYRLMSTLTSLEQTLKSTDQLMRHVDGTIAPQVRLRWQRPGRDEERQGLLAQDAPLQSDLGATLLQLSRAAKSVTALVDYLERHPESLLRGKPGDSLVGVHGGARASRSAVNISVDVIRMTTRPGDHLSIETHWRIIDARKSADVEGSGVFSAPLGQDTYSGVAEALSECLGQLADRLVTQIQEPAGTITPTP
jgi:hypothetical protein